MSPSFVGKNIAMFILTIEATSAQANGYLAFCKLLLSWENVETKPFLLTSLFSEVSSIEGSPFVKLGNPQKFILSLHSFMFQIIPVLRSFCVFASMGILGVFMLTLFLFTGVFVYDQKRVAANRNACWCLSLGEDYKPNECSQKSYLQLVFRKIVAKVLALLPVKVSELLIFSPVKTNVFINKVSNGLSYVEKEI